MKRLLSLFLVLILFCAAAIWLAPALVDFNAFRMDIEKQISEATGRDITIEGDISMRLLPEPALQVHKVSVRNAGKGPDTQPGLSVEELRLNAEFWPLLNKQVKLTSVHLVRPAIDLAHLTSAEAGPEKTDTRTGQKSGEDLIAAVSLDAVKIIDGRISLADNLPDITSIDAELHAPSLNGPFSVNGSIDVGELSFAMDLTTGRLGEGQSLPVELTLMTQDTFNSVSYSGVINIQGESGLEGNFQLALKDPAATLAKTGFAVPSLPGAVGALGMNGVISYTPAMTKLSGLEVTVDDNKMASELAYTADSDGKPGLLQLALKGDELNLTALSGQPDKSDSFFKTLDHTDLPSLPLSVAVSVSFARIVHDERVFEDVDTTFTFKNGGLTITKLHAKLPGRTQLAVKGAIAPEGVRETAVLSDFDLAVNLRSEDPQSLVAAFGGGEALPIPRGEAVFTGRVQGMTNGTKISDAQFQIASSQISFFASYVDSDPPRIELAARCDSWALPAASADGTKSALPEMSWIQDYKIEFDLKCDSLALEKAVLKNVQIKGGAGKSGLQLVSSSGFLIDRLQVGVNGSLGQLSPPGDLDIKLSLKGSGLADAMQKLGIEGGKWVQMKLFDDIDVAADFTGDFKNAAFTLKGDMSGLDLQLGGTAADLDDDVSFEGKVRLQHQDAATALKILLPDSQPPGKIYGNLDLYTELAGNKDKISMNAISGKVGEVAFSGTTAIDLNRDPVAIDAKLQTTSVDLNKLGVSQQGGKGRGRPAGQWAEGKLGRVVPNTLDGKLHLTMDGLVYGKTKLKNIAAIASLEKGALKLSQLDAETMGGRMGLTGVLSQPAEKLDAEIDLTLSAVQSLQLFEMVGLGDAIDGVADATVKIKTTGSSEKALAGNLSGAVTYLSEGGNLNGVDLENVSDKLEKLTSEGKIGTYLLQALEGGKTPYQTAQADIRFTNGVGTIKTGEVITEHGDITGKGRIDLPKWRLNVEAQINLIRPEDIPNLPMSMSGPLHSPQKRLGTDLIRRYLADKFARQLEEKFLNKGKEDPDGEQKKLPDLPIDPEDAFKNLLKNL